MDQIELQQIFFNHIKAKLPGHFSMVDEIAAMLNISNDSAYRRIRGDKQLSLNELRTLCLHFKISLDQMMGLQTNAIVFYGDMVDNTNFVFENYLISIQQNVDKIASIPNCHFYYEAKDIPLFHHFQYPELAAFKCFFWMRIVLQDYTQSKKIFDFNELSGPIVEAGKKIAHNYSKIHSTEIWNIETVNSSIRQIEFCYETGMFADKKAVVKIFETLLQLIEHIETEAASGFKFTDGSNITSSEPNFNLYINEVLLGHNSMLIDNEVQRFAFINHNVLNFMITYDKRFCDYTYNSLQNIIRKSNLISRVNEKERTKIFNSIKNRIKDKIQSL